MKNVNVKSTRTAHLLLGALTIGVGSLLLLHWLAPDARASAKQAAATQEITVQRINIVDADVAIDRRSILQWIVDPLLSVTGRV